MLVLVYSLFGIGMDQIPYRSIVSIQADLEDGFTSRRGLGTIIDKEGRVLTVAHLVHDENGGGYADTIMMHVINELHEPLVCYAQMGVMALDMDRDLAILEPHVNTDIYCNPIEGRGSHHRNYYARNHITLFETSCLENCPNSLKKNVKITIPAFPDTRREELRLSHGKINDHVLLKGSQQINYIIGYLTDATIYLRGTGGPVFDETGMFTGISLFKSFEEKERVRFHGVLSRSVALGWLCELAQNRILPMEVTTSQGIVPLQKTDFCKALSQEDVFGERW